MKNTLVHTHLFPAVLMFTAVYCSGIGVFAYVDPQGFFLAAADYTGAFNAHLVRDVGAAFITAGVMLILAFFYLNWRTPCAIAGALFLLLHGVIHCQELWQADTVDLAHLFSELFTVLLPAVIVVLAIAYDSYSAHR